MFRAIISLFTIFLPIIIGAVVPQYAPVQYAEASVFETQPPVPQALRSLEGRLLTNPTGALYKLNEFQTTEKNTRGVYHQFLWTHDKAPGSTVALLYLDNKPTDARITPRAMFTEKGIATSQDTRWKVDIYNGPSGEGYQIDVETVINGVVWRKSLNTGPETYRATDWVAIQSTAVITP
jgi:hypothetical protein